MIVTAITMYVLAVIFMIIGQSKISDSGKAVAGCLTILFLIVGSVMLDFWLK